MRPFLSLSLPEVPSYEEFSSLVSLQTSEPRKTEMKASGNERREQALSILEVAEQAMKMARQEWEAVSRQSAEAARCQGCEDWWKSSIRDVVRASIAGNIAVATMRKGLMGWRGQSMRDVVQVELPELGKRYHSWWVVPSVSLR